jgi:TPR repeat protein
MAQTSNRYISERLAAAERGRPDALYDLGLLFSTGQGVELNLVEAHKWFNLAAQRGIQRAHVDRAELARDMSPAEIAEAQRQAREWLSCH